MTLPQTVKQKNRGRNGGESFLLFDRTPNNLALVKYTFKGLEFPRLKKNSPLLLEIFQILKMEFLQ